MDIVHRRALPPPSSSSSSLPSSASGLNPNAPLFVPMAYRAVEDFSEQWWQLVESSAWFRDYWFRQQQQQQQRRRYSDPQEEEEEEEEEEVKDRRRDFEAVLLADEDSLFHGYQPAEEEKRYARDLAAFQGDRWNGPFSPVDERRILLEKATQLASIGSSPWTLQRPI